MTPSENLVSRSKYVQKKCSLIDESADGLLARFGLAFKAHPEDFLVKERADFSRDEKGHHLCLRVCKENLAHEELINIFRSQFNLPSSSIGYAGRKDKDAITEQHISVPRSVEKQLQDFNHPRINIVESFPIASKIRIGQLRGNSFVIFIGGKSFIANDVQSVCDHLASKGLVNYFGEQRFSRKSWRDLPYILKALENRSPMYRGKQRAWRASVVQSCLFNCFVDEYGHEYSTGPMFGWKSRAKTVEQQRVEQEFLRQFGLDYDQFRIFVGEARGTRRLTRLFPEEMRAESSADGLRLRFYLPRGSYATVVVRAVLDSLLR